MLIQSYLIPLLLLKPENIISCPPLAKDLESGKCMAVLPRIRAIFADKLNNFSEFLSSLCNKDFKIFALIDKQNFRTVLK